MDDKANVQRLRDLGRQYQKAAQKLLEAAEILERMSQSFPSGVSPIAEPRIQQGSLTRKEQMISLIKERGPLSRKEIIEALPEVPLGTISYILQHPEFELGADGKWKLKEFPHQEETL